VQRLYSDPAMRYLNANQNPVKAAAFFSFLMLLTRSARAADPVSWNDLPKAIGPDRPICSLDLLEGPQNDHTYTVATTTGEKFRFRAMGIDDKHLWGDGGSIPRELVAEIGMRHRGRFADPLTQMLEGGIFLCEHGACGNAVFLSRRFPWPSPTGSPVPCPASRSKAFGDCYPPK
jgi:hypothetical protein